MDLRSWLERTVRGALAAALSAAIAAAVAHVVGAWRMVPLPPEVAQGIALLVVALWNRFRPAPGQQQSEQ